MRLKIWVSWHAIIAHYSYNYEQINFVIIGCLASPSIELEWVDKSSVIKIDAQIMFVVCVEEMRWMMKWWKLWAMNGWWAMSSYEQMPVKW